MKAKKFDNVQLNQIVTFYENDMIQTGVVCNVENNKFTLRALRCWDNNGIIAYNEQMFTFFKTGTKTHAHYTYGNAIEITGNV
jgi:hypothetical protein